MRKKLASNCQVTCSAVRRAGGIGLEFPRLVGPGAESAATGTERENPQQG